MGQALEFEVGEFLSLETHVVCCGNTKPSSFHSGAWQVWESLCIKTEDGLDPDAIFLSFPDPDVLPLVGAGLCAKTRETGCITAICLLICGAAHGYCLLMSRSTFTKHKHKMSRTTAQERKQQTQSNRSKFPLCRPAKLNFLGQRENLKLLCFAYLALIYEKISTSCFLVVEKQRLVQVMNKRDDGFGSFDGPAMGIK